MTPAARRFRARAVAAGCLGLMVVACGSRDDTPQPLGVAGSPKSATPTPSATPVGETSTFRIAVLHGTLHVQGKWVADDKVAASARTLATQMAAGAPVITDLAVSKTDANLSVVSFASMNPTGILERFWQANPNVSTDPTSGDRIAVAPSRSLTIAGDTAVTQDFDVRNPKGELINQGTFYAVNAGDHVVVIRTRAQLPAAKVELPAMEKALIAIG